MKNQSELYNNSYVNNALSIIIYKNGRKNSRCELINVNHLISHDSDRKISDNRIMEQFISIIEKSVYYFNLNNKHIEFSIRGDFFKQSIRDTVNGLYYGIEAIPFMFDRKQVFSIEQYINHVFSVFCLIYPYNTISTDSIFNNQSIKYFINQYYHN